MRMDAGKEGWIGLAWTFYHGHHEMGGFFFFSNRVIASFRPGKKRTPRQVLFVFFVFVFYCNDFYDID